jgi:hypothetical protein
LGPKPALGIDWDELGAGAAFQGQNSAGSATVCDSFVHSTIPTFGLHSSKHGKTGPGTAFAPSPQDIAMRRLTADLSITIPCLLAMVIIMVVGLAVIIEKQFDNITWTIQEFVSRLAAPLAHRQQLILFFCRPWMDSVTFTLP